MNVGPFGSLRAEVEAKRPSALHPLLGRFICRVLIGALMLLAAAVPAPTQATVMGVEHPVPPSPGDLPSAAPHAPGNQIEALVARLRAIPKARVWHEAVPTSIDAWQSAFRTRLAHGAVAPEVEAFISRRAPLEVRGTAFEGSRLYDAFEDYVAVLGLPEQTTALEFHANYSAMPTTDPATGKVLAKFPPYRSPNSLVFIYPGHAPVLSLRYRIVVGWYLCYDPRIDAVICLAADVSQPDTIPHAPTNALLPVSVRGDG